MMRHWREREFAQKLSPRTYRSGLRLWARLARQPVLYHAFTGIAGRVLGWAGKTRGRFRSLPLAGGLDRGARPAGTGGPQLSQPVGRASAR